MTQRKSAKVTDEKPSVKRTFTVNLTKGELTHLRDLFNVAVPPLMQTISQALAVAESRPHIEGKLWQKISRACVQAGVDLDDAAPDFVATASAPPPIAVYRIEPEANAEQQEEQANFSTVFGDSE